MKWNSNFFSALILFFAVFQAAEAANLPQVKTASKSQFQPKKLSVPPPRLPKEYQVFEKAAHTEDLSKLSLNQIVEIQRQLKNLDWTSGNKTFEKEIEDLFWFYEIARAQKVGGTKALSDWMMALQSLSQFKWIYAWTEKTSSTLASICKKTETKQKDKKVSKVPDFKQKLKEEKCNFIAKKVNDAFPKGALETQPLKAILPEKANLEATTEKFDRLSQSYSEKLEKDELAFAAVLDLYLSHRDSDLNRQGKLFIEEFPKSMLRYRAMFLMAERLFANRDPKEAEPYYQQIIQETPYSYYAIVSGERLGISLPSKLSKEPIANPQSIEEFGLNIFERESFCVLENLVRTKKEEPVSFELEQFSRLRQYPTSLLVELARKANQSRQDLSGFKFASEILQRKGEAPLRHEFMDMIFPDRYSKEIEDESKKAKIDPLLVVSLMKQESGFKKAILSSSGAVGLMQLMPFTALEVQKDLYLRQLRNPAKNIEVGTKYIASLLNEKFNGNVVYALAGYNAGPFRVVKWKKEAKPDWGMQEFIEAIPFKETRDYVMSILRNRHWYQYKKGQPVQSVFEAWRSP